MSKVKLNILRFLEGDATPEEMKKLEKWSGKSDENQQDLKLSQDIYNHIGDLNTHIPVDASSEWTTFLTKTQGLANPNDADILNYIDGTADYKLQNKMTAWSSSSTEHKNELASLDDLATALKELPRHQKVDSTNEYLILKSKIASSQKIEKIDIAPKVTPVQVKSRVLPMWVRYAAAACLATVFAASIYLWNKAPATLTYATTDTPGEVTLSDGTVVDLGTYSKITYFGDIKKVKERKVELSGTGVFDVAKMPNKPFELITPDKLGISVLGTIFSLESSDQYLSLITTMEGSIKAFNVDNPSINTIINEGESVGFSMDGFEAILEEIIVPDNSQAYSVLKILDHLMENSNWKVTSSPNADFRPRTIVNVDLDQSYEEIILDLAAKGVLTYRKPRCSGCYVITSLVGK